MSCMQIKSTRSTVAEAKIIQLNTTFEYELNDIIFALTAVGHFNIKKIYKQNVVSDGDHDTVLGEHADVVREQGNVADERANVIEERTDIADERGNVVKKRVDVSDER